MGPPESKHSEFTVLKSEWDSFGRSFYLNVPDDSPEAEAVCEEHQKLADRLDADFRRLIPADDFNVIYDIFRSRIVMIECGQDVVTKLRELVLAALRAHPTFAISLSVYAPTLKTTPYPATRTEAQLISLQKTLVLTQPDAPTEEPGNPNHPK